MLGPTTAESLRLKIELKELARSTHQPKNYLTTHRRNKMTVSSHPRIIGISFGNVNAAVTIINKVFFFPSFFFYLPPFHSLTRAIHTGRQAWNHRQCWRWSTNTLCCRFCHRSRGIFCLFCIVLKEYVIDRIKVAGTQALAQAIRAPQTTIREFKALLGQK